MVYYDGEVLANSAVYGVIGSELLKWLKKTPLVPFINTHTFWVNRGLAILIAGIAAVGVNYQYTYTPDGVLTLTLTGLTVAGIWEGGKQWILAYAMQQLPYHVTKPTDATATATAISNKHGVTVTATSAEPPKEG